MNYLLWLTIPAIILLGIITSIDDIKKGKIRNKYIIAALVYALLAVAISAILMFKSGASVNMHYFADIGINMLCAIIVAFLLSYASLWTAGDAKLFIAYSALVPLSVYHYGYVAGFPSFTLLVNIFVPFFVILFFIVMIKTTAKEKFIVLKQALTLKNLAIFSVTIFALMYFISYIFAVTHIPGNYFTMTLVLFILMIVIEKVLPLNFTEIMIILACIRLVIDRSFLSINFAKQFLLVLITLIFLRFFIIYLSVRVLSSSKKITELKKGDLLAEDIFEENGKISTTSITQIDLLGYLQKKREKKKSLIGYEGSSGLTEQNIEAILALSHDGKIKDTVQIYTTLPFAPFLFLSVILTYAVQGDVFIFLLRLFST